MNDSIKIGDREISAESLGEGMGPVTTTEIGKEWYVNVLDVTELPTILRSEVASWINTDVDPWCPDGKVDSVYYPITAEDQEQLQSRVELLRDGTIGLRGRKLRVESRSKS